MENAKHSCSLEVVGIFHVLCVWGWMIGRQLAEVRHADPF